jgi:kynurenine formamidase
MTKDLGIHVWLENGGIVSRGVLLDYASWAEKKGMKIEPLTSCNIPVSQLKELMKDEGITTQPGDVLFIRSGWTAAHLAMSPAEEESHPARKDQTFIGVESSLETARWIWENKFAAVAGDMPGFEQSPIWGADVQLHQIVLAGWGCPLGEMFYLEDLAKECKRLGRHHFFMTSMPLRVSKHVLIDCEKC